MTAAYKITAKLFNGISQIDIEIMIVVFSMFHF